IYAAFVSFIDILITYTSSTYIYTLSLHDALPIFVREITRAIGRPDAVKTTFYVEHAVQGDYLRRYGAGGHGEQQHLGLAGGTARSEEHTSELQSRENLVCRLLLEKKKHKITKTTT